MWITDIDHVQIAGPEGCEPEARRFFCDLLQLQELEKPEPLKSRGGCWFQAGPRQLHIGIEDPFQPARKAHPAFAVRDIEGLFRTLAAANVGCKWDEDLEGVRRFFANDPWGNRLEFVSDGS